MPLLPLLANVSVNAVNILSLAAVGFGIIGVMAAAAVVARSSSLTRTHEILRDTNTDLEKSNAHWRARYDEQSVELAKCEGEKTILRDLATSRADITEMLHNFQALAADVRNDYLNLAAMNQRLVVAMLDKVGMNPDLGADAGRGEEPPRGGLQAGKPRPHPR